MTENNNIVNSALNICFDSYNNPNTNLKYVQAPERGSKKHLRNPHFCSVSSLLYDVCDILLASRASRSSWRGRRVLRQSVFFPTKFTFHVSIFTIISKNFILLPTFCLIADIVSSATIVRISCVSSTVFFKALLA